MKINPLDELKNAQFWQKLKELVASRRFSRPNKGWIYYFRSCLSITQADLGKKLGISQPAVRILENSEARGNITLKSLNKVARVFDCEVEYRFIPRNANIKFIEKSAFAKARREYETVNQTMALENRALDKKALDLKIQKYADQLKTNLNSRLWR